MTSRNTQKSEATLVAMLIEGESIPGCTLVGAREFPRVGDGYDASAELVLEGVNLSLLPDVDTSLWRRLKSALALALGRPVHTKAYVSLVLDRSTATRANDELIEALYSSPVEHASGCSTDPRI